jgi:nucleoside phosphorylase
VLPEYRLQEEQSNQKLELQPTTHKVSIHVLKNPAIVQLNSKMKTDVLLTTATPVETKAVLELFPGYQEVEIREKIYFDLGLINDLQIVLIQQTHMGSNGTAGSHISIKEAIEALSPLYVIMVGIAFGIDASKQDIGDILVSQHIQNYDLQRVSTGPDNKPKFENRGERVTASTLLLSRFMAAQYSPPNTWPGKPPKIDFGLILSGSKLVDHEDYRNELRNLAPDAIGGEMEGIGLYHAASDKKVHWIVVKAICDWADGNKHVRKNDRQQLAAKNAAIFTLHVLQRSSFKHHRRTNKKTTDK